MVKLIFLIVMTLVLISVASSRDSSKKCKSKDDKKAIQSFTYAVTALTGKYLYQLLLEYPGQSYTIVTLPLACILGHLAYHADGEEYKKIMKVIGLKNKEQIKTVVSNAVSAINDRSDTKSKLSFAVFSDESQKFTTSFKQEYKDICNGVTESVNYDCPQEALKGVDKWFSLQSNIYKALPLDNSDMFCENGKQGIVYATYMDFIASFNHPANPSVLTPIDFEVSKNKTLKFPSLYGVGLFKYSILGDLDAKLLILYLQGGEHFGIFFYPNNPENLLKLMKNIQDPKVFYGSINRAKWMCMKAHITIGHAHVVNDLFEFVSDLWLNSTDYKNVFKSGEPARVNYGFQQLQLVGDTKVREGPMNSNLCPENDYPFIKMNHPCAYYVMSKSGMIVYGGIILGPQNYAK